MACKLETVTKTKTLSIIWSYQEEKMKAVFFILILKNTFSVNLFLYLATEGFAALVFCFCGFSFLFLFLTSVLSFESPDVDLLSMPMH